MIGGCWYGEYGTVADSAEDTEKLCCVSSEAVKSSAPISADDFSSRRKLCEDLVRGGIPKALSLQNPRQLRLPIKRRHVCWELLRE
ncbi:protein kinase [Histoplasma capsulatum var. duboisii H88]|uniref:Protein kinase n=1 Tax=Ajellomyces capsulatus (strain H88) TaxID=544711 RepID=A0A8A1LUJ3_AJEC8|nr:protein kinase [Histoplasma capsulatum var. duboisii H88]